MALETAIWHRGSTGHSAFVLRSCAGDIGVALRTRPRHSSGPGIMVLAQESSTGSLQKLWAGREGCGPALGRISWATSMVVKSLVPNGVFGDFVSKAPPIVGVPLLGAGRTPAAPSGKVGDGEVGDAWPGTERGECRTACPARPESLQAGATGDRDNLISWAPGSASPLLRGGPRSSAGRSPGLWWGEFITFVTALLWLGSGKEVLTLAPSAPVVRAWQGTQTLHG